MPFVTLAKIAPTIAPHNVTSNPGVNAAARPNNAALITSANNPNVRQVNGNEMNCSAGLTNAVSTPSTMPNVRTATSLSYVTNRSWKIVPTASTATMLPTI